MLQITPQHKIHIAIQPVNFRKGIDGLKAICQQQLQLDPFSGNLFIFCNSRKTAVKILIYDSNGFWLCHKRFSQNKLKWWPHNTLEANNIRAIELIIMLQQGHPFDVKFPPAWRQLQD
jgi:transposase